ncbi:hypothetical protein [Nemorincola caseinilytica]
MKLPPYTYHEAKALSGEHQHIVGLSYDQQCTTTVDMVVVAPHDQNSRNRFLMLYLMLNDADAALSLDYSGTQYDVMVISGSSNVSGMQQCSLHQWLTQDAQDMEMQCADEDIRQVTL